MAYCEVIEEVTDHSDKLFREVPSGMNATGESDLKNYYDYVNSQREAKLRPVLECLLSISAWGAVSDNLQIDSHLYVSPRQKSGRDCKGQD